MGRSNIFMVINFKIVKSTLQNTLFLHFFSKKFAYIKKKQYLCIVIEKQHTRNYKNLLLTIKKIHNYENNSFIQNYRRL